MTKKELLNKLKKLQKGFPTDLVYINRKIDNKYVQAPHEYNVSTIDEFLGRDIQAVFNLNTSIIRPILGMFGSGKSTILNRVEKILPFTLSTDQYLLVRINLKTISIVQHDEFIKVLMKRIYPILKTSQFKTIFENVQDESLIEIFQGLEIIKNIKNLYSKSESDRISAKAYFLDSISEERIFQVIEGVITLAKKNGRILVILIDELEYLIRYDEKHILTEIMVSRFLRGILEKHDSSVYIVFTCYKEAYESLKQNFYNFYRIVEGLEIKLGDLSIDEKKELIQKILDETMEYTFGKINLDDIMNEFKARIDFYMGSAVKLIAQEIFTFIDQFQEIAKQCQKTYEINARQQEAIPKLFEWDFKRDNIREEIFEVGGYNFDIFASESNRNSIVKRAFGEIKSVTCNKAYAEDFTNWIKMQIFTKSNEYLQLRDKLIYIAPNYTKDAMTLLKENGVFCIEYIDPAVERILEEIEKEKVKDLTEEEKPIIAFINGTISKSRTYNVVFKKFPNVKVLEGLVNKNKIEIKPKKGKKCVCLKL